MGSRIAAHFANAGIPALLLDLPSQEGGDRSATARKAIDTAAKAKPGALFSSSSASRITPGNFDDHLAGIASCDWVIEAVTENLAVKRALWARALEYASPAAILSTNTSGIPLSRIAESFPAQARSRFLGTHFFNPPRYLHLVEVIPTPETSADAISFVSQFCDARLGKGVVVCKDTPNFIANRIGSFFGGSTAKYALEGGFSVEEVDALTGPLIGLPSSASFRLLDIVGLDVWAFVGSNLHALTPDDPWRERFLPPPFLEEMLRRGWLGEKSGQGFYRRVGKGEARTIEAVDLHTFEYKPAAKVALPILEEARAIAGLPERLRSLVASTSPAGTFLWKLLSDHMLYAAERVPEISDRIVEIDRAMRWGYAHTYGPFELWDALGFEATARRMEAVGRALPESVTRMLSSGAPGFYRAADAAGTPPDATGPTPDAAAATPDAAGSVPDAAPATPDAAPPPVGFCGGLGPFPQALTEGATLAEYLAGFADLPPTDPLQAPHHYGRVMADFDCDGRQDILLTRRGSATMTLLRGGPLRDGLPLLPGRLDVPLPPGFTSAFTATAADLNRDAVPELLVLARDNGLAGRLRVLVYPVDRATGAFGTPLVADVSRGLAAPNELNPDAGGPFPLSVVRKRSVERPSIVLLTLAEASVFTLPARDAQREWDAVRAERLIPDPAGGTAFSAAQAALPWPRPDGGEDLVVAEDVPGHRFRADALGWQRIWNGNLSAATHRIFVPFDADDDADVEFLAAFQHANGTDPIADVLEPAMPEGGAPFVVRPLVAQGVFSASGSWYAATATRADVDTPFDALFSGPAPGGHGLWLLPDITWDAVDRALHPTRPVAFRSFADFAPHHIFWGQFDGAPGLEAVLFDDATGLRCVRAALGVPGVAPDIVACE